MIKSIYEISKHCHQPQAWTLAGAEEKGIDMWDTGMSALGIVFCVATGPIAMAGGIIVGCYFLGRLIYDLNTGH